ncbi:MAG: helix-turn-helix domain-containing protein [Blautia producta]|uniref:DNA-binding protein n=2 Tax=Blautia producta TaxID=33035 RepID=A0A7G5N1H6_9FIRM|nr:helix-turn-helix domain-containing protein [Blautia producta]MDU5221914.1 helix-turn-helix domain-containing protein [Blautia producta]MDU5383429.1 helix-turn-helix domain-containing protein [Blautia producta]MDU6884666.1 helix-turn-helix domain-containing protein [Blautia producta]QIB56507.1 helix-turn-helix domain-containing protein [Blautia producta ATCC 27340 = DSM 2950]QMW80719.1 DNA-binding protein [Blautia producta]
MLEDYKDVLQIDDIMEILKIGRNKAYDLIHAGEIKSLRIGRKIRVPKACMIDFLTSPLYNNSNDMFCSPVKKRKGA